jgi:hypothetical protein
VELVKFLVDVPVRNPIPVGNLVQVVVEGVKLIATLVVAQVKLQLINVAMRVEQLL